MGFSDIQVHGRLLGFLRIPYKIHSGLGRYFAGMSSGLDDGICKWKWTVPFAGHLIVEATKPQETTN